MLLCRAVRILLRRAGPVMYATSFVFNNHSESKKPMPEDKLNLEPPDIKKLTIEYMIQQSTIDSINNATQTLTIVHMAVMRTSSEYKTLLNLLISLLRESLEYNLNDKHLDMIVEVRSKVQSEKEKLNKLTGYIQYVQNLAVAASDLSYLSGMDNLSFSLSQQLDDVLKRIKTEVDHIEMLEGEYCDIQEQCIRNSSKTNDNNVPP
ncbi:uncharacterized protein LOC122399992 isoform X1 [Colletes gigas]|uniref:uncharacterized protein LOC122399992 isoform X1 n=1 Tax=Colletes gigas TaxID=935657 RepID=UPI001C9B0F1A|nr:uncharacterized protein LOC122399992 isoform X1 [Colletes gigas]XP_043257089.1 uncharacterized protein LOC122399992 isoform X1 [Colletes gigas]XP_043257097.1 uncharacterized protein LOC122399992 isoform X1 [Colletes gigas]